MGADPTESTQPTLLHRLNETPGDSVTCGRFEAAYGPVIRDWCGHWGLDGPAADEVARSVLVRLTAKLPAFRYDARGTFRAWLRTLAQHAWHDLVSDSGF
jgi:RNA polymerase sigma-70 factor (ECF subfamily)